MGPSQLIAVENGRMILGTWQGIFFCEFDGREHASCWFNSSPIHDKIFKYETQEPCPFKRSLQGGNNLEIDAVDKAILNRIQSDFPLMRGPIGRSPKN